MFSKIKSDKKRNKTNFKKITKARNHTSLYFTLGRVNGILIVDTRTHIYIYI
jgi:hypothetical protein